MPVVSKRFVEVPSQALLAEIDAIGAAVVKVGGSAGELISGKEIVRTLRPPKSRAEVRIYTSIAKGGVTAKGCGEDAIRIFWGFETATLLSRAKPAFKPMSKSTRVFRTAPKGEPAARLQAFLERFRDAVREVYTAAHRAPRCPQCQAPMVERSWRVRTFWGCAAYPACKGTRPGPAPAARLGEVIHNAIEVKPLSGHEVVAAYGMPHGEMAAEQVQAGLDAEAEADSFGHAMYEGGSALAQGLIRANRAGRRRFPW